MKLLAFLVGLLVYVYLKYSKYKSIYLLCFKSGLLYAFFLSDYPTLNGMKGTHSTSYYTGYKVVCISPLYCVDSPDVVKKQALVFDTSGLTWNQIVFSQSLKNAA